VVQREASQKRPLVSLRCSQAGPWVNSSLVTFQSQELIYHQSFQEASSLVKQGADAFPQLVNLPKSLIKGAVCMCGRKTEGFTGGSGEQYSQGRHLDRKLHLQIRYHSRLSLKKLFLPGQ
jgi:hypothetical protein